MDSLKRSFSEKISDPTTPKLDAALLGALVGIPLYGAARILKRKELTPLDVLYGGALGAGTGVLVNEVNRRYFSDEYDRWRDMNKTKEK